MQPENSSSVLKRKAKAARQEHDARAVTPAKALRLALELTGDALFKLALTVQAVEQRALTHGQLRAEVARVGGPLGAPKEAAGAGSETAPEATARTGSPRDPAELSGPILLLLDGPGGLRGAVMVGRALVQALVEVQTMGKVSAHRPPERPFTPTDAAVCAPLLDALFLAFADKVEEMQAGAGRAVTYRFGDRVEDARALGLALEADDFDLFELEVDVARGVTSGRLTLLLPAPLLPPPPAPEAEEREKSARFNLAALAMSAPVTLNAVLDCIEMPLSEVCALKPGALVPISSGALAKTELVASERHVVGKVRLGQMNGFRAVRFATGLAPDARAPENDARAQETGGEVAQDDGFGSTPATRNAPRRDAKGATARLAAPPATAPVGAHPALADPTGPGLDAVPDPGNLPALQGLSDLPGLPGTNAHPQEASTELPGLPDLPGL